MEAEKTYQNKVPRTIQQKRGGEGALEFLDNRQGGILQAVAEPVQRLEDEEETLQGKFEQPVQRLGDEEDETLQGKFAQTVQREEDDDEALQGKFEQPVQKKNETGMPDNLKAGIEDLSGFSMDDVRVHYNSDKPATVQALAYTQGTDIHVAPGQEQHLPHEAWHVAQQMAGRVEPTTEVGGLPVNDNMDLEHEADVMGAKALQRKIKYDRARESDNIKQGYKFIDARTNDIVPRLLLQREFNVGSQQNIFIQSHALNKYSSPPIQRIGLLGLLGVLGITTLSATIVHDLYQRYKRYIKPADETSEFLSAGGAYGFSNNSSSNISDGLETFRQVYKLRNDRQDDTRRHLSPLGKIFSYSLRSGHTDIDEILIRAIKKEFPNRNGISEEEFEFVIQKVIMGSTRTRGWITGLARKVGKVAEAFHL